MLLAVVAAFAVSCGAGKSAPATTSPVTTGNEMPPATDAAAIAASKLDTMNDELSETELNGKTLFENRCGTCHRLYKPAEFSEKEWGPILLRMQRKARMTDAEIAQVQAYVFHYAE
jgi:cytochrome c5